MEFAIHYALFRGAGRVCAVEIMNKAGRIQQVMLAELRNVTGDEGGGRQKYPSTQIPKEIKESGQRSVFYIPSANGMWESSRRRDATLRLFALGLVWLVALSAQACTIFVATAPQYRI